MNVSDFSFDLTTSVSEQIQCSVCGQPNQFGQLCSDCIASLQTLLESDAETQKTVLILGLRILAREFREE